jgi:diguanylate cyclase (GGDEF)-like protein
VTITRHPRPLAIVVATVCAAGSAAFVAAAVSLVGSPPSAETSVGLSLLVAAMILADRFPVRLDGLDAAGISLSFVFGVAAVVLFGSAGGLVAVVAAPAVGQLLDRRPPVRVAYNASVHGLAAGAGGLLIAPLRGGDVGRLVAQVALCALAQLAVNTLLVSGVVSVSSGRRLRSLLLANLRATAAPFGLMASAALMLVVLWQRSPGLSAALVGPLLAISLYQRSTHRALRAMRLALTDPLTGLGNHRHFHERLREEMQDARRDRRRLALCLVDIDDFKLVNDRFGHPAGDRVLAEVAARLRQGGESFRLGGDEFALLLVGASEDSAVRTAQSVVERIAAAALDTVGSITVSAGIASADLAHGDHGDLVRRTDDALYTAKKEGKNAVRVAPPELGPAALRRLAGTIDAGVRRRAAATLATAVDERESSLPGESLRAGELAARIAVRLGVAGDQVELLWLAGSLHDLGKLAVPEAILRKRDPLTPEERATLEGHAEVGSSMLVEAGAEPIAAWVRHHHERWDGRGYPDGIPGEEIPLGGRILSVADAYQAMTAARPYRPAVSPRAALAELRRCAGTQFDPEIVAALEAEVGLGVRPIDALAS